MAAVFFAVIVRDIGDREAMPYVPVEAVDGPPPEH